MDWIKKHTDSLMIMGSLASCMIWMNAQFNSVDKRFSELEKDLAVIKTVLIMKNIMPSELATNNQIEVKEKEK